MEISSLVRLLGELLGEVIVAQESQPVFETEEHFRFLAKARREGDGNAALELPKEACKLCNEQIYSVAGAFALYFDLVNIAEEVNRVNVLRARRSREYPQPINNSIGAALETLKANGVSAEDLGAVLENLRIELVLTSHPTQSKRRTVLAKVNSIRQLADKLWQTNTTPQEKNGIQRDLRAAITTLWLTDRARTRRPEATDEVRTGLYFVDNVFWQVLPRIYRDLEEALAQHYRGLVIQRPWLTLASWVGGDRDGNPNVTHRTTAETLRLHRGLAVEKHGDSLRRLSRELSMSDRRLAAPAALETWFAKRRESLPERVAFLAERYEHEPYRLALALLAADLQAASQENMASHLLDDQLHVARSHLQELLEIVETINTSMPEAVRQSDLHDLRIQLAAFGLQAARLDLREHARRINAVLAEILRSVDLCADFQDLDPSARAQLLGDLLSQPSPQLNPERLSTEGAETWALFKLMVRAKSIYGSELFGPFIISMAREAADVLAVQLLAYWAGGIDSQPITPLFETLDDLEHCPEVLTRLFNDKSYAAHLQRLDNEQMVMIGYSDSNKDGGYLAAQWAVYRAQERITAVCEEHGIKLTIFHGRGGSIARGGGPANRAIQAQPPGSIRGRFRVTEQGETIAFRYGDPELAYRNLEQIVHAVLVASLPHEDQRPRNAEWQNVMNNMAAASLETFRGLINESGFITFWQEVTPLEEITRLHLSSRPASRGAGLALENLRAIPWVFSWMQSRFNLPGWFGLGSGLRAAPSLEILQDMYAHWPFFRALLDNAEVSMLKADMGIAELYLSLASDVPTAQRLFAQIRAEYDLSVAQVLRVKKQMHLLDDDPLIQRTVQLRNPYVDPLNYLQVEVLRRLRALPDTESEEKENLRATMIQTINGIAAGLRNTG